jgi:hypothetical protein
MYGLPCGADPRHVQVATTLASASAPELRNEATHEFSALREIAITKAKEVMTGDHDPTTGSPLQQPHRIVAEARCCSASAELFVDGQSNKHRIYVRG